MDQHDGGDHEMEEQAARQLLLEFDSDSDDGEDGPALRQPRRPGVDRERIPLHQFLRLIAGARMAADGGTAASNEELVDNLKRGGVVQSDAVYAALRCCPRDRFVPHGYRDEALVDAPIRLEELDFNVSAPHMHATCLEALQVLPGHRVLDVGSGCGLLTAAMAVIAGHGGLVRGIDTRPAAVRLAKDNVRRLAEGSNEFSSRAVPLRFEVHNVFIPSPKHQGQYDRVHVGATCPPDKLHHLLQLLRPGGGVIVTPVRPNDLRVITQHPDGSTSQRVISQVRYGDLEVPTDMAILAAQLDLERASRTAPPTHPSTFATDVAAILADASSPSSSYSDSSTIDAAAAALGGAGGSSGDTRRGRYVQRLLSSCSGRGGGGRELSPCASSDSFAGMAVDVDGEGVCLDDSCLGDPDCALVGSDWALPVHRSVLRTRCELFRARCDSGMRDAGDAALTAPDHFNEAAMRAFVHYLYRDELGDELEPRTCMEVLHVAQYYGAPRLAGLCEVRLAEELKGHDASDESATEAAPVLLALSEECGLPHLQAVALDYIVHRFCAVSATEAYRSLSKAQTDLVASEAVQYYSRMSDLVQHLTAPAHARFRCPLQKPLPDP